MKLKTTYLVAFLAALTMIITGCGNSGTGTTYTTVEEPVELPNNTDITFSAGGDGEIGYSYAEDGSIIVGSDNGEINIVQGNGTIENTTIITEEVPEEEEEDDSNETT